MRYITKAPRATLVLLLVVTCVAEGAWAQRKQQRSRAGKAHRTQALQSRTLYANPALAGDYPDPSIIRVGKDYWATATTSEWAPEFPILHSRDLVNWETVGAVFHERPQWSVGNYWAPEISEDKGRFFVYYVGRKKDGPLCVAVATAAKPTGPYTDHGPLVCQEDGSIDPVPVTDERGQRYLIWKEDGNSRSQPTPLWAQRLSDDGTKLIGEKKELLRNDAPWEAQLVEGPYVLRHNGWFYLFYSGNACCGRECNYALGVARARHLLGPWEKNPANPILAGNETWKCPGHGSIVTDERGRTFLLYHAYSARDSVYAGRQAMLDEVKWSANGWPTINDGRGPSVRAPSPLGATERNAEYAFFDDFTEGRLSPGWQWPQSNEPIVRFEKARAMVGGKRSGGQLLLQPRSANGDGAANSAGGDLLGAVLARSTTVGDYVATALVDIHGMKPEARVGLAAYGDRENALGIAVSGNRKIFVYRREKNEQKTLAEISAPVSSEQIYLRMTAMGGRQFHFAASSNGRHWMDVGNAEGAYLPPWDRAVRVALTAGGAPQALGRFDWLRITPLSSH